MRLTDRQADRPTHLWLNAINDFLSLTSHGLKRYCYHSFRGWWGLWDNGEQMVLVKDVSTLTGQISPILHILIVFNDSRLQMGDFGFSHFWGPKIPIFKTYFYHKHVILLDDLA